MKALEIKLEKQGFLFSTKDAKGNYKNLMSLGRCFPSTKAQATFFITSGVCLDVLNVNDVMKVEALLNSHGLTGDYVYTKSKTWVRLTNNIDLFLALKKEFINK